MAACSPEVNGVEESFLAPARSAEKFAPYEKSQYLSDHLIEPQTVSLLRAHIHLGNKIPGPWAGSR